jgi:hypothetical protein
LLLAVGSFEMMNKMASNMKDQETSVNLNRLILLWLLIPVQNGQNMTVGIRYVDYADCPQKSTLTSPTNDGRSVGIVRSRSKATEFVLFFCLFVGLNSETVFLAGTREPPHVIPDRAMYKLKSGHKHCVHSLSEDYQSSIVEMAGHNQGQAEGQASVANPSSRCSLLGLPQKDSSGWW